MTLVDLILPEFDTEMDSTRRLLERVPGEKADWKPHPKSMSLGDLSLHVANLSNWAKITLTENEFDMQPPGTDAPLRVAYESMEKTLEMFDGNRKVVREVLAGFTDERFMEPWSLKHGGHVLFTQPRHQVLRGFVMNHMIHHRGQLDVYLRLNDVPLPEIYGPTADTKR